MTARELPEPMEPGVYSILDRRILLTPEDMQRARLYVCSRAEGVEDAALILDMLGLREEGQ